MLDKVATSHQQFEQAMAAAIGAFNIGRLEAAEDMCQSILRSNSGDPAVHQLLAVICLQQKKAADAHLHIASSLKIRPHHVPSLITAGRIALARQDMKAALAFFEKARVLAPEAPEPIYLIGSLLAEQGKLAAAVNAFLRLVHLNPSDGFAWCSLGTAYQQAGMKDKATDALEKAIALDPHQADAWFNLGLVRQDQWDLAGAAAAFRAALQQRPDFVEAAVNLGIVMQETGLIEEAMKAYRTAYQLRSDTFGRIANALAARPHGRMWLNLDQLRQLLVV
jgi:tetratricopeptide (TPR) repeat protein